MIITCDNCKNDSIIDANRIPNCGYPISFDCRNCGGRSFVSKIGNHIDVRFDAFSMLSETMTLMAIPVMEPNSDETGNDDAMEIWNACVKMLLSRR